MKEEIKEPTSLDITEGEKFGGYTLEDLRYRRAMAELKKEFAKAKMINTTYKLQKRNPFSEKSSGGGSALANVGGIAGKIITGLSYLDYVMIGFSVFNTGRKFLSFFKKKKK